MLPESLSVCTLGRHMCPVGEYTACIIDPKRLVDIVCVCVLFSRSSPRNDPYTYMYTVNWKCIFNNESCWGTISSDWTRTMEEMQFKYTQTHTPWECCFMLDVKWENGFCKCVSCFILFIYAILLYLRNWKETLTAIFKYIWWYSRVSYTLDAFNGNIICRLHM